MKVLLRHFAIAAVPLACGIAAGYAFAHAMESCGAMVGLLFASKCHGRQQEYQLLAQIAGTALGTVIATFVGTWLELRRRRIVQLQVPNRGDS